MKCPPGGTAGQQNPRGEGWIMEIRYFTDTDDRNGICRIYAESWKYAYRGMIPQDFLDSIADGKWMKNLDIPGQSTMICFENGEYIGVSSFGRSRYAQYPDCGEVISLYFLPEYIGKGYGRQLLRAVLDELRKQGYPDIILWVLEGNERAIRFYETFGFVRTKHYLDTEIGGRDLREISYVYHFGRESGNLLFPGEMKNREV